MNSICQNYWEDAKFNGAHVNCEFKPCMAQEEPLDDYTQVHKVRDNNFTTPFFTLAEIFTVNPIPNLEHFESFYLRTNPARYSVS